MGEKRRVCGQCKWYFPFTAVCTNGDSERRADFVDQMNDTCDQWESYAGHNFQRDNFSECDETGGETWERLIDKGSGKKPKDRIQHKKPIGGR